MNKVKPVKHIGCLLYDMVTATDIVGPTDALAIASDIGPIEYRLSMLSDKAGAIITDSSIRLHADTSIYAQQQFDLVIIPGGSGSRDPDIQQWTAPWLVQQYNNQAKLVSVCTGAFLLANAGLLDQQKATTHWAYSELFKERYPQVNLVEDALYIEKGSIATSAGITAGIDLTLKLIEDSSGSDIASAVARYMVVNYRRAGDQSQYSQPLRFQRKADTAFANLSGWMLENIQSDLSVARLAEFSGMSERNFYRKFKQQIGLSPAKYIEQLRLDYSRQLLIEKDWPNKRIAQACGYPQVDVFRRAFERRFGVSPKQYRLHFSN